MSDDKTTIGEYLVKTLEANGIDTVFGIPGVHTLELYRPLAASQLRHVLVRHEQGAGFMADGFARMSGQPAAAFVISGPGVTNILTPAAQAYSDSVPMLVIASTPVRASLGKQWGVLHELRDQRALAQNVFGFTGTAFSADDVRDHLRAAFASFSLGRRRPAYLEIPLDLLAETTRLPVETFASGDRLSPGANIERAVDLLEHAERPFVIAGGGACRTRPALAELVEKLDGYLACTAAAKGVLRESHPANLGVSLPYRPTQELVASADVVLAVGTEIGETDLYTSTRLPFNGRLIRIDIDPVKLSDQYDAEVRILGDAESCLEAINRRLSVRTGWRARAGSAADVRSKIEARFDVPTRKRLAGLRAIRAALPADGAIFSDMTQIAYLGNYAFPTDDPGLWHHPSGYGTLGFAVPAACGAKFAAPSRAVIALAGDFGVQFTLPDLMTAVEASLSLPIVLWNNSALGQIRDDMVHAGIREIGVIARNPDFVALGRAFGAPAVSVAQPAQLTEEVARALERRGPTLIEAIEERFPSA